MTDDGPGGADLLERARTLRDRVGAPRRPGEERAFTDALLALMRSDGLVGACVPAALGGPGLGLGPLARVGFQVARVDGSAGLVFAMHMSQALSVVRHGRGPLFEDFQRRMARDQVLIASGTSEKGPGGDIFTSIAQVEDAGDGRLRVTKESPNISYVDQAGAILVSANRARAGGKPRQVLILAERAATDFVPGREASFLGMRGMLNGPWTFTATFGEEAVFPEPFAAIARRTMTPTIQILWAATWSGIAAAALDAAKAFVSKEVPADAETAPLLRHQLTRLADRHYMMNAMIRDAIAEHDRQEAGSGLDLGHAARINRLKVCASELLTEICQGALGIVGLRGYATGGPYSLAQPIADGLSASIMVSNLRLSLNNAKVETFVAEEP